MTKKKDTLLALFACCFITLTANDECLVQINKTRAMFQTQNWVGIISQSQLPSDCKLYAEEFDWMRSVAHIRRNDTLSVRMMNNFMREYPQSSRTDQADIELGDYYYYNHYYREAVNHYERVDLSRLSKGQSAEVAFRRGVSYLKTGNENLAKTYLSVAGKDPRFEQEVQFCNAYLLYQKGDYNKALQEFSKIKQGALGEQAAYYIIQIHFQQKKYQDVIDQGRNLMDKITDENYIKEMYRLIGESYFQSYRYKNAILNLGLYFNRGGRSLSADYAMGVSLYMDKQTEKAIPYLEKCTKTDGATAQSAYYYLGECYIRLDQKNKALLAFEQASRSDINKPTQEIALYNYALLVYETALTPFSDGIIAFEKFLKLYPKSRYADQARVLLSEAYTTTKNYDAALSSIQRVTNPDSKTKSLKQHLLLQIGLQLVADAQFHQALDRFSQIIELGPVNAEAYTEAAFWRGECLYRDGKYEQAENDFRTYLNTKSKEKTEKTALAYYNLAYSCFKQKKYDQALLYFQRYIDTPYQGNQQADLKADAFNRAGDCHYYSRNFKAADSYYYKAMETLPEQGGYALYQRAFLSGLQNNSKQKLSLLDELLKKFPSSSYADQALFEKATTQIQLQQNAQAIISLDQLIREYPASPLTKKALMSLGMVYLNNGEWDQAIVTYKRIITDYPNSDEAKMAMSDMKTVYLEQNKVSEYADYINSLGGDKKFQISEQDSLTFLAAERLYLKGELNHSIQALENYLRTFENPSFASQANYYLGVNYYNTNNMPKALTYFDAVLKQNGSRFAEESLRYKGEILMALNKDQEALGTYVKLQERASSTEIRLMAAQHIMRLAYRIGKYEQSLSAANQCLSTEKLSPEIRNEANYIKAVSLIKQGRSQQAVSILEELSKDPRTSVGAESAYLLAQYYFDSGNLNKAESTIMKLINKGTPHQYWLARGFILLSDIYLKNKDPFQAKQYLTSLQNNYQGNDDIASMIQDRMKKIK